MTNVTSNLWTMVVMSDSTLVFSNKSGRNIRAFTSQLKRKVDTLGQGSQLGMISSEMFR